MNQVPVAFGQPLVRELDLGSARGGKAGINREPLSIIAVRGLTADDLPAIQAPPPVAMPNPVVKQLRHSHHRLAQLMAEGKSQVEISFITGYSQSYISAMKTDPAFQELVAYYHEQGKVEFLDTQEKLRVLGIDATEKLQEMIHDPAQPWSPREVMEVIELALIKPNQPKGGFATPGGSAPAVSLEVKFVGAQPVAVNGPIIDITPNKGG